MLTPLYEAKVDPDIYLFGFALTRRRPVAVPVHGPNDDPGWFFVIKERPGEPRFGLDTSAADPADLERPVVARPAGRGPRQPVSIAAAGVVHPARADRA